MLAVVGAVNLVGRVLAKRAEARSKEGASEPVRGAREVGRTRSFPATVRTAPIREPSRAGQQPATRVAQAVPAAITNARSDGAGVGRRSMPVAATTKPAAASKPRNRWNARTLRRAFVASEILGSPVGLRP